MRAAQFRRFKAVKESESFITSRVAAKQLGVSLRTVQLWVEKGALRAWKTAGGHRRIARSSVEELLRQQRAAIEAPANGEVLTVVVVEDEPVQLQLYEMKFEEWALPVRLITATNGFEGLIEIVRHKPDLVVTDLDMPGMDGFQMIRAISKNERLKRSQIVVVTGLDDDEIAEAGGLPVSIPVFHKPIVFDELRQMLGDRLGGVAR